MRNGKRALSWWLWAAVLAGGLMGGLAAALPAECWKCWACGCATDGGYLECCGLGSCE